MIFISSKNSSITKNSQYVEIENQPNGNSAYQELTVTAYQELTVPESDRHYHNLTLK